MCRPRTTVILAMSADGKIGDNYGSAARFSSSRDLQHLERQIARVDGVIFGANTLRAYGTGLSVRSPDLLAARKRERLAEQPVQMVLSRSGDLDPDYRFFRQPFPRWLITSPEGMEKWRHSSGFDRIILFTSWENLFQLLLDAGIDSLAVLGGGEVVAALLEENSIDELYLTLCPVILGGKNSPTPVDGRGFVGKNALKLELLDLENLDGEVFLHYRVLS